MHLGSGSGAVAGWRDIPEVELPGDGCRVGEHGHQRLREISGMAQGAAGVPTRTELLLGDLAYNPYREVPGLSMRIDMALA